MTIILDTIEMTRRIRDTLHEQTKTMSSAERIAFYHAKAQSLHHQLGVAVVPIEPERAEHTHNTTPHDVIQQDGFKT